MGSLAPDDRASGEVSVAIRSRALPTKRFVDADYIDAAAVSSGTQAIVAASVPSPGRTSLGSRRIDGKSAGMDPHATSSPPHSVPPASTPPRFGRVQARRLKTRARLLEAAYALMSKQGVDATTIKEITERADTGFGTFYNYFSSKDDVAARVLDCVINSLGRRNDLANQAADVTNQVQIVGNSLRLVAREMMTNPMWHWWVKRPDLMIERMRAGFGHFGLRDLRTGRQTGAYRIIGDDLRTAWSLMMWLLSGNIKDINDGYSPSTTAAVMAESIMRMLGVPLDLAHRMSNTPLPASVMIDIDFSFILADEG